MISEAPPLIPKHHKFGAVALSVSAESGWSGESKRRKMFQVCRADGQSLREVKAIQLENDLMVLSEQPLLPGIWKRENLLGARDLQYLEQANLVVLRTKESSNPKCLDNENEQLLRSTFPLVV